MSVKVKPFCQGSQGPIVHENLDSPSDFVSEWSDLVFDLSPDSIFLMNSDGELLHANRAFFNLIGYKKEELPGLTIQSLWSPEEDQFGKLKIQELFSGESESAKFESQIRFKSGVSRMVEMNASVVRNELILVFLQDIHDKKIALDDLHKSQEQLYKAEKLAKIGSWGMDLTTGKLYWSKGMYDLIGVPYDFVPTPEGGMDFIHPDDRGSFLERLAGMEELVNLEIRHITDEGVKHVLINSKIEYKDGQPWRYHGTSQDVTHRRLSDQRLGIIESTAKLGWFESNLITGVDVWSDSLYDFFGFDKKTTIPSYEVYIKTVHPEDVPIIEDNMTNPEKLKYGWYNQEIRLRRADGTYGYFLTSGRFEWDGKEPVKLVGTIMDISKARETQTILEEAQRVTKFGWWEVDIASGKGTWSDAIYEIMGVDTKIALDFDEYVSHIHPDDRGWLLKDPSEIKDGWNNVPLRYIRENGSYTYVLSSGKVIFAGDRPIKLLGTNMDITPLKEAQIKLKQAQEVAKLGWWEFDLTGLGADFFSPEFLEILGLQDENEIDTKSLESLVHPEDIKKVLRHFKLGLAEGGWTNMVTRVSQNDGTFKYISSNAKVDYLQGDPVRIFGSIYDVSSSKEIEYELAKNLVNLQAMVNSMENVVFVIDDKLRFREVFCNDFDMLDETLHNVIGRSVGDVWRKENSPGGITAEMCKNAIQKGKLEPIIHETVRNGRKKWWEINFSSFGSQDGKKWLTVVLSDVTAKKFAEEELLKSIQKEKQLTEMRSQFVSMASHQFRTPLSVIKFNMHLLELSEIKDPIVEKVTKRTTEEVDRLVGLMENILNMGKLQSNAIQPSLKPVDIVQLIKRIKLKVESQQEDERQLNVKVIGKPVLLNLDCNFMEHAITNLVENAFKYSPGTSGPEVQLAFGKEKLRISIIDYGIGIVKSDYSRLFTPFFRGDNVQHINGTGLGLSVTREFIQANNGTIFLNSNRSSGTEFCIDMPI